MIKSEVWGLTIFAIMGVCMELIIYLIRKR